MMLKKPIKAAKAVRIAKAVKAAAAKEPAGQLAKALAKVGDSLPLREDMATEPDLTHYVGAANYEEYVRKPSIPGLPQFLRDKALTKPTMTKDKLKEMLDAQTGTKREWVMPDNSPEANAARAAAKIEKQKLQIFVNDDAVPVTVSVMTKDGPKTLTVYPNMAEFRTKHDFATYPFKETRSDADQTVVLVSAKPWAAIKGERKAKAPSASGERKPSGRSKVALIGDLLLRPTGCTTTDVLAATGWPAVSMPAQAKLAGLTLRKVKVGKVTTYYGRKT